MRFEGKVAVVTGAASGIGRATAVRFAAEGAKVVLADRDEGGLRALAETLPAGAARVAPFDAGDPASCRGLIETATGGGGPLDILCNIAGVLDMRPLADIDDALWARMIGVNLGGPFHLCRAAMPHLIARRGCIVNMASAAGLVGVAYNTAYVASKHGLVGLTKALALEFANDGVRVNAICPTGVKTPMLTAPPAPGVQWDLVMRAASWLDNGAACEADDIADAVLFLASDAARMITGVALPVDGGQTAG
jgi:NAD(P)-dependent dehydrogenase (short-subunit alcohol dehydrogenase family)